jgi:hypothetical protein
MFNQKILTKYNITKEILDKYLELLIINYPQIENIKEDAEATLKEILDLNSQYIIMLTREDNDECLGFVNVNIVKSLNPFEKIDIHITDTLFYDNNIKNLSLKIDKIIHHIKSSHN